MVVYAIIVEASIGKLLVAGFIPGFISAICYSIIVVIWSIWNPNAGRPIRGYTWGERFASLPGTLPVIGVILIIFASMLFGWATPTEAGALGAFVVYIAALLNRMKWRQLNDALIETAKLTVMIFAIIWGILIFVRFLGFAGVPERFSEWVVSLPVPRVVIMLGILFVYLVLGCFMDAIGMLLLTLPVFYPAVMKLGYDPIWFGIIVVKMCGVCLLTPPIGLSCFVVAAVRRDIPLADVFRGALPFVIADFMAIGIFLAWPADRHLAARPDFEVATDIASTPCRPSRLGGHAVPMRKRARSIGNQIRCFTSKNPSHGSSSRKSSRWRRLSIREMVGAHALRELVPGERRRDRGARQRAGRVGADRGRAAAVAQIVDEDAAAPRALAT